MQQWQGGKEQAEVTHHQVDPTVLSWTLANSNPVTSEPDWKEVEASPHSDGKEAGGILRGNLKKC